MKAKPCCQHAGSAAVADLLCWPSNFYSLSMPCTCGPAFCRPGLQLQNLDATGLKHIFKLLQNHYVEQLAQLVMVGAPTIFWGLWRVVSPFIDPETRKKVVFVGAGATATLLEDLGAQVGSSSIFTHSLPRFPACGVAPSTVWGVKQDVSAAVVWLLFSIRDLVICLNAATGKCVDSSS